MNKTNAARNYIHLRLEIRLEDENKAIAFGSVENKTKNLSV